jgi:hypothetical protein
MKALNYSHPGTFSVSIDRRGLNQSPTQDFSNLPAFLSLFEPPWDYSTGCGASGTRFHITYHMSDVVGDVFETLSSTPNATNPTSHQSHNGSIEIN